MELQTKKIEILKQQVKDKMNSEALFFYSIADRISLV